MKFNFLVALVFILVSFQSHARGLVIGGKKVNIPEVRGATVSIVDKKGHSIESFCTGTLISANVIVSAAHCVSNITDENLYIAWGEDVAISDLIKVTLVKFADSIHPMDSRRSEGFDFSILVTEKPVPLIPVSIGNPASLNSQTLLIQAGYGFTRPESEEEESPLDGGLLRMIDTGKFLRLMAPGIEIRNTALSRIALGDSGGPLYTFESGELKFHGALSGYDIDQFITEYSHPAYFIKWMNCALPDEHKVAVNFPLESQIPCDGYELISPKEVQEFQRRLCRKYEGWDWDSDHLCAARTQKACKEFAKNNPGFKWNAKEKICED